MGVDAFGLAMGLGFVLSFGYWCTDFLVVQRAMAAHSMTAARRVPLIGAFPKMMFPFLVVMPGLIALAVHPSPDAPVPAIVRAADIAPSAVLDAGERRLAGDGNIATAGLIPYKFDEATNQIVRDNQGRPVRDYDLVIPVLLLRYFPAGMLGLGLTALMASFMSGMAGNVTAFNTVWTYDIYQAYIRKTASDAHYLMIGRLATFFGIAASVATAYVAAQFNNIMDVLQLVFAFVNAPLLGTFLLGMFWKRTTGHGAFTGLLAGTSAAAIHHGSTLPLGAAAGVKGGWFALLHLYPSEMAQNFYTATCAFTVCFIVTIAVSLATRPRPDAELVGLVHSLTEKPKEEAMAWYLRPVSLAAVIIVSLTVLNILFY
jgi:SSS family solute:Na+ symporter